VAAENNHHAALPIYSWLSEGLVSINSRDKLWLEVPAAFMFRDDSLRLNALHLLRAADLGITDIQLRETPIADRVIQPTKRVLGLAGLYSNPNEADKGRTAPLLELQHRDKFGGTSLPLEQESNGTRFWLSIVAQVLRILKAGSILCIDELDTSLHPYLALEVI